MSYEQGDVRWGPAPHKSGPSYRPWVIVSDSSHPFAHTECIALAMTTQQHAGAIAVSDDAWLEGGSEADAYISPWYTTTIKHRDFDRHQGTLEASTVAEAVTELHRYTPAPKSWDLPSVEGWSLDHTRLYMTRGFSSLFGDSNSFRIGR